MTIPSVTAARWKDHHRRTTENRHDRAFVGPNGQVRQLDAPDSDDPAKAGQVSGPPAPDAEQAGFRPASNLPGRRQRGRGGFWSRLNPFKKGTRQTPTP